MSKLTTETRNNLPDDDFAVPHKRVLPIHDAKHVKFAWDMVSNTKDLTGAERKEARRRIIERAHKFGLDTSDWNEKRLNASADIVYAMSLNVSTSDHVNKAPFTGILTRIDEPSDAPPEGSGGRRITISAEAAKKALPSILCMAVDYVPKLDGHDPKNKIGVITAATIDGDAIAIEGFLYAADFPDAVAEIKANKDALGFSYEARNLFVVDPDSDPVIVTACTFTGAAILFKDKAAYKTTSISASAGKEKITMDEEIKKVFEDITTALASVTASVAALQQKGPEKGPDTVQANAHTIAMVEPHAKACEACANAMEAAGIGTNLERGHATVLRKMAGHMRASAAVGHVPHIFRDHDFMSASAALIPGESVDASKAMEAALKPITDKLAALGTQLADVKAAATLASTPPERKTLPPAITQLLAKAGVEPDKATGKIEVGKLDEILKASGVTEIPDRLKAKAAFRQAGVID